MYFDALKRDNRISGYKFQIWKCSRPTKSQCNKKLQLDAAIEVQVLSGCNDATIYSAVQSSKDHVTRNVSCMAMRNNTLSYLMSNVLLDDI